MTALPCNGRPARMIFAAISLFTAGLAGWGGFTLTAVLLASMSGGYGMVVGLAAGIVSFPFWLGGVFIVGGPIWIAMRRWGRETRRAAQVAGAVAAAVCGPLLGWAFLTDMAVTFDFGALFLAGLAVPAAIGGATAGHVFWNLIGKSGAS